MAQHYVNYVEVSSKTKTSSVIVAGGTSHCNSELGPIQPTPNDPPVLVNTKPDVAELVQASRGSKRSQLNPSAGCKRIKKYELPNVEDPSVRNAVAAKAHREKKKKELEDLKTEIITKNQIIENMTEYNKGLKERLKKAKLTIDKLNQQQSSNGIMQVGEEIAMYMALVLPQSLGANFEGIPEVIVSPEFMPLPAENPFNNTLFNLDPRNQNISTVGTYDPEVDTDRNIRPLPSFQSTFRPQSKQ